MKDKNGVTVYGGDEAGFIYSKFVEILDKGASEGAIDQSDFITQLKAFLSDKNYSKILDIGDCFYRARCVSREDCADESKGFEIKGGCLSGFNEEQSGAPPYTSELKGRCDVEKVRILYAANDIETACSEVRPLFTELISVATYAVTKPLRLFNVTHDITTEEGDSIEKNNSLENGFKKLDKQNIWDGFVKIFQRELREPNYKIPQIISKYIHDQEFDGMIYYSSQGNGLNYAFFNPMDESIQWVESQLYICTHKHLCFNSFNDQRPLRSVEKHIDTAEVEKIKAGTIHQIIEKRGQKQSHSE